MSRREPSLGWVTKLYGGLLVILPRPFREKYGKQLVRTFRDVAIDASVSRGRVAMLAVRARMFAELFVNAPKEHFADLRHRSGERIMIRTRNPLRDVLHDVGFAIRTLRRNPTFALVAVVTLALGIGANSAIFSVLYSITMRPLPYEEPERLAWLSMAFGENPFPASEPEYLELAAEAQSFEAMAAYLNWSFRVNVGGMEDPQRVSAGSVTANFLPVLGVQPLLGRGFAEGEDRPGADAVAILAYGFWQRSFGGDERLVGQSISMNGKATTVIGVMPESFRFPGADIDLITVNVIDPSNPAGRASHYLAMIGRLRPGETLETARAEIAGLTTRWTTDFPGRHGPNERHPIVASDLHDRIVGDVRPTLFILAGAVSLVLLIACANVANLTLARAESRHREVAIRKALGGSRGRLVSQLLTESTIIALFGGGVGLVLALWGVELLTAVGPLDLPRLREVRVDSVVLAFTALVSVGTGLLFGIVPALSASGRDVSAAFKDGSAAATAGGFRMSFRRGLVAVEIALAVVLVVGSGLLIKSLGQLQRVDPGFDPRGVITMDFSLAAAAYPEPAQMARFHADLVERVEALPGIVSAGSIRVVPLAGTPGIESVTLIGREHREGDPHWLGQLQVAGPGFFEALAIPLLSGRPFTVADRANSQLVLLINRAMATTYWPDGDALGKQLKLGPDDSTFPTLTVVGVVGDVRQSGLEGDVAPQMFVPRQQAAFVFNEAARTASFVVRVETDPVSAMRSVRAVVREIDPQLPLANVQTMERVVARSVSDERFMSLVMAVFSSIALALGAVGIYGLMAYSVAQRTREIGLRMALGADKARVLGLVLKQALGMTVVGIAAGVAVALAVSRVVSGFLFEVAARDPVIFVGTPALLFGVALLAAYLPARRAATVDPMVALHGE